MWMQERRGDRRQVLYIRYSGIHLTTFKPSTSATIDARLDKWDSQKHDVTQFSGHARTSYLRCTTSSEITRSPTFISRCIHAHQIYHSPSLWDFWVVLLLDSVPFYIISYQQQVVLTNTWLPWGTPSYKLHLLLIYSSIFFVPHPPCSLGLSWCPDHAFILHPSRFAFKYSNYPKPSI